MTGVELHNFNIKFLQLWNAGHDAHLTVECRADKATIIWICRQSIKESLTIVLNDVSFVLDLK